MLLGFVWDLRAGGGCWCLIEDIVGGVCCAWTRGMSGEASKTMYWPDNHTNCGDLGTMLKRYSSRGSRLRRAVTEPRLANSAVFRKLGNCPRGPGSTPRPLWSVAPEKP